MKDLQDQFPVQGRSSHGGDIYSNNVRLDLSVNLNPLGMPKEVAEALKAGAAGWSVYPDPLCSALRTALSARIGVDEGNLIFGNGAAELIYGLVLSLRPKKALICAPTFSEYEAALLACGCEVKTFAALEDEDFSINASDLAAAVEDDTDLVFLCNPNNPTGQCLSAGEVRIMEKACHNAQAFLCVDECFMELTGRSGECSVLHDCENDPKLCVLRAFTKTYALAGVRLGYLVCNDKTLLSRISALRQPWSVSAPAQTAGLAALTEVPPAYLEKAESLIASERERMSAELKSRGFHVIPSEANFIMFYSPDADLYEKCLSSGILIRDCSNFAALRPGYFRIGLRTEEEDDAFLAVMDSLMPCSAGCSGICRSS